MSVERNIMEQLMEDWTHSKLLSVWQELAQELTGKKTRVAIHKAYDDWKRTLTKETGLHPRLAGRACSSLKKGMFLIHLYVPENRPLEESFELVLHEIAHLYLGHLGERTASLFDMEAEADAWVAVNFCDEIGLVARYLDFGNFGYEAGKGSGQKQVSAAICRRIRREIGDWFLLTAGHKAPLAAWLNELRQKLERDLKTSQRMREAMDRIRDQAEQRQTAKW